MQAKTKIYNGKLQRKHLQQLIQWRYKKNIYITKRLDLIKLIIIIIIMIDSWGLLFDYSPQIYVYLYVWLCIWFTTRFRYILYIYIFVYKLINFSSCVLCRNRFSAFLYMILLLYMIKSWLVCIFLVFSRPYDFSCTKQFSWKWQLFVVKKIYLNQVYIELTMDL